VAKGRASGKRPRAFFVLKGASYSADGMGMVVIGQPSLRGFRPRPEPLHPNRSMLFLVHLRERIRPTAAARRTLIVDWRHEQGWTGVVSTFR
jgi:hypothetical protein